MFSTGQPVPQRSLQSFTASTLARISSNLCQMYDYYRLYSKLNLGTLIKTSSEKLIQEACLAASSPQKYLNSQKIPSNCSGVGLLSQVTSDDKMQERSCKLHWGRLGRTSSWREWTSTGLGCQGSGGVLWRYLRDVWTNLQSHGLICPLKQPLELSLIQSHNADVKLGMYQFTAH